MIIPFVAMIAVFVPFFKEGEVAASFHIWLWPVNITWNGLQVLTNTLVKAWLSILCLTWLTSTTAVTALLGGLQRLRMPRVLIMIMSFMYRYLFILVDEVLRMKQARDSRGFGGGRLWQLRTIGNMVGTLFIRSYERGERVYAAMVARGFDGRTRTVNSLHFRRLDAGFGAAFAAVLAAAGSLHLII
jgi:cobalt/nickel transport system permease protein